jgi:hypothetical protein
LEQADQILTVTEGPAAAFSTTGHRSAFIPASAFTPRQEELLHSPPAGYPVLDLPFFAFRDERRHMTDLSESTK